MSDTQAPPFALTLAGTAYPLIPSLPALRAIERMTGATIFSLVEAGADGALTIDHLTAMTVAMADAPEGDALFNRSQMLALNTPGKGNGPPPSATRVAGAIVEEGLMTVTARVLAPLAAVMAGRTTAAGALKAEG